MTRVLRGLRGRVLLAAMICAGLAVALVAVVLTSLMIDQTLKRIGTLARKDLVELLGCRVYLELHVRVERDWTRTARGLRRVGFTD